MFFDPTLRSEPKRATTTEPSLQGLIAWLEQQPPETTYDFLDFNGKCLICQYLGRRGPGWGLPYRDFVNRFGVGFAVSKPWTFGAALARARALTPEGT